jgi:hypothetical protein
MNIQNQANKGSVILTNSSNPKMIADNKNQAAALLSALMNKYYPAQVLANV